MIHQIHADCICVQLVAVDFIFLPYEVQKPFSLIAFYIKFGLESPTWVPNSVQGQYIKPTLSPNWCLQFVGIDRFLDIHYQVLLGSAFQPVVVIGLVST